MQFFKNFGEIHFENFVDFEKCCKMRIWMQHFVSIQPSTSLKKTHVSWVCPWRLEARVLSEALWRLHRRWRGRLRLNETNFHPMHQSNCTVFLHTPTRHITLSEARYWLYRHRFSHPEYSRYVFCSIFQNLQNYLADFSKICKVSQIFTKFC